MLSIGLPYGVVIDNFLITIIVNRSVGYMVRTIIMSTVDIILQLQCLWWVHWYSYLWTRVRAIMLPVKVYSMHDHRYAIVLKNNEFQLIKFTFSPNKFIETFGCLQLANYSKIIHGWQKEFL